jgi:hypothetical protein
MKKLIPVLLLVLVPIIYFSGCSDEDNPIIPVTTASGIFVLYEGDFSDPTSYDYGFIDIASGNVTPKVFRSVNGISLNKVPDGMLLHGNELYITAQGNFSGPGSIYRINSTTNQLIASDSSLGKNPYSLVIYNSRIYVSSIAGDFISVLNLDLSPVNDSLGVGPNPADLIAAMDNVYISKASYTLENSLAIVHTITNTVSKVFFSKPPVSVANNIGGVYVSTYSHKKLYIIDSLSSNVGDSIDINISEPAIGTIIAGSPRTLYILGVEDTTFSQNTGKKVYKLDLITRQLDPNFNIAFTGIDDAYGISYDPLEERIYITNSKSGQANGELRIYDKNGGLIRTYSDVGGKFPKRTAIKY